MSFGPVHATVLMPFQSHEHAGTGFRQEMKKPSETMKVDRWKTSRHIHENTSAVTRGVALHAESAFVAPLHETHRTALGGALSPDD